MAGLSIIFLFTPYAICCMANISQKSKYGFTLVEVLVTLSILSFTAVLAYSHLGRSYMDASLERKAVQVANDMRMIAEAVKMHYLEQGSYPSSGTSSVDELASDGYLKGSLMPPSDALDDTDPTAPTVYQFIEADIDGSGTSDRYITLVPLKQEVCEKIHEQFTNSSGYHDVVGGGGLTTRTSPGFEMFCNYHSLNAAGRKYNPVYIMQWR